MAVFKIVIYVGIVSICLVTGSLFNKGEWNSCSPHPGQKCQRCDCTPDCMDLSDEKNCSYGDIERLFLSMQSVFSGNVVGIEDHQCGATKKFFPPPPLPPFAMCDPPVTEPTTAASSPTQPRTTAPKTTHAPTTPSPRPPDPSTSVPTTQSPTTAKTTHVPLPPTTPFFPHFRQVWDYCRKLSRTFPATLSCTERMFRCMALPTTRRPTTTTTTTTTTTLPPVVTSYYYDYYDYTQNQNIYWNWIEFLALHYHN